MAIKNYIKVSYLFENEKGLITNSTNYCNVTILPELDMSFEAVNCILSYQVQGKIFTNTRKVATISIDKDNNWKKNENYTYQTSFELGNLPSSYNGANFQITWWLYLEVDFDNQTKSTIRNTLLKDGSIISALKSFDGKHENKNAVTLSSSPSIYEISPFSLTYKINPYTHFIIGCFISIVYLILLLGEIMKKYLWAPPLIGAGFIGYGIYKIIGIGVLKEVQFSGKPIDDKHFELEITFEKNSKKIDAAIVSYSIIEKVIDNRGTSSTTYKEAIYKSEEKTLLTPISGQLKTTLNYPDKNIPLDFRRDTIEFYAQIEMKLKFTNHTKGILKQIFPLKKIK